MTRDATHNEPNTSRLIARQVRDEHRLGTLPRHFGRLTIRVEQAIYQWMERLCPDYQGSYWDFYEVSNGAFFMAPTGAERWRLSCPNQFAGELSAEAMGITVCLYALSNLCFCIESDELVEHFHALRAFASEHAEAALIVAAID